MQFCLRVITMFARNTLVRYAPANLPSSETLRAELLDILPEDHKATK
jgi:hypothetical protein